MTGRRRMFVMGDPQAPMAKVLAVLEAHAALGADGRLAEDVVLVSMGDHFDYDLDDPVGAGVEGLRTLRWLANHDPAQVQLLFGNHDAARVMELIRLDDTCFAAARALGRSMAEIWRREGNEAVARCKQLFAEQFPDVPTPGLAARDYASYSEAQRELVIELLLAGRFHLALSGVLPDGREVLLTHAGVTQRELVLLGLPDERDPHRLAAALEQHMRAAIEARRAEWQGGARTPLSLAPLHVPGSAGQEGGGLLYHRPVRVDRPGGDPTWELDPARPRRFDPRSLPRGLRQVAGHTGHRKCKAELGDDWLTEAAREHEIGGIRTLRIEGDAVLYDLGVLPGRTGATDLHLVDGEMRHVAASDYPLLPLAELLVPA
ncbi:metallophosphoesterase [Polyangium sp. y55x31]|uniref:metallophosphoesterase n=1 Tax=Polyangium sp. y55x31 TaxID=3042688 RepID=UPI0024826D70|nr:metallophosphoesterase [Polyangium sp. y55x31]MDI1482718.1 metallophosphoesterase [Polyangium sp. y55x31]